MVDIAHRFKEYTTPNGAQVTEVLVNGAACHWEKAADGTWACVPNKGGDCDQGWTDDGCREKVYIFGTRKKFTIVFKCICQNSVEDALNE